MDTKLLMRQAMALFTADEIIALSMNLGYTVLRNQEHGYFHIVRRTQAGDVWSGEGNRRLRELWSIENGEKFNGYEY